MSHLSIASISPLSGCGHKTPVLEQHGTLLDPFTQFYIIAQPLYQFLRGCALTGHPTDQHYPDSWLRIPAQDLLQFLKRDAFAEQPSSTVSDGYETPAEKDDTPSYPASWLIPAAELYQFLQLYVLPASELPLSVNEIPVEQNGTPDYTPLLLIPAGSLDQFLQLYEIPELLSSGNGNETPAEHQPDDGSEDDAISVSVTPTQSQDSDQVNDQLNGTSPSSSPGCPVCKNTFPRVQERNRHVESYLPHSICCPLQGCSWTGRRQSDFNGHLEKKHPGTDQVPMGHAIELYDPREFVKNILDGMPVDEVARSAFTKVHERFGELAAVGNEKLGANVLGRSRELRMWVHDPSTFITPSLPD